MFDLGFTEMAVIAVVAILIIGPKQLPVVLRTIGKWMGKARSLAREFQDSVNEAIRESELEDVRKEMDSFRRVGRPDDAAPKRLPDKPEKPDKPDTPGGGEA